MARSLTLKSSYLPAGIRDLFLVVIGSCLIALSSSLSFKLPFTPVPIALAPHVCLGLALVLGKNRATLAVLLYLFQGILGLPVFALGDAGLLHLLGPRGGYLLGYVAGTYLTGSLIEKGESKERTLVSLILGNGMIYLLGAAHLSLFIGLKKALILGVLPFLFGDALKLSALYLGRNKMKTF